MKETKKIIIGCVALVLILAAGFVVAQEEGVSEKTINRVVVRIDSLSCGGCFSTINAGLVSIEGYSGMGANLFRKLIAVDFTDPMTPDQISAKLSEVGYPGEIESFDQVSTEESFAYLESRQTGFGSSGANCCGGPGVAEGPNADGRSSLTPQVGGFCCDLPAPVIPTEDL